LIGFVGGGGSVREDDSSGATGTPPSGGSADCLNGLIDDAEDPIVAERVEQAGAAGRLEYGTAYLREGEVDACCTQCRCELGERLGACDVRSPYATASRITA
jgi:hypothetical protein